MSSEAGDTVPEAAATAAMAAPPAPASDSGEVEGSCALRPVFLGNLLSSYTAEDVTAVFERPQQPQSLSNNSNNDNNNDNNGTTGETETLYTPIPVDRVDLKRGYCFVFLKDAATLQDKRNAERFVTHMNGM
jgi:arginine/serine-rich splicing factor 4/5/6